MFLCVLCLNQGVPSQYCGAEVSVYEFFLEVKRHDM